MKLGFPRALTYYDYYPFWAGFFHELGIEFVCSPLTNRRIMEAGLKKAPDETCLPVKVLVGHIHAFDQVKGLDGIFLPRLVSVEEDTYLCPKILGVPESVLHAVPTGLKVYSVDINWRNGKREVLRKLELFGLELGRSKTLVREAFRTAQQWLETYERIRHDGWTFEESIEYFENRRMTEFEDSRLLDNESVKAKPEDEKPRIALIGHSYLAYESYASLNLLQRLKEKADVSVVEDVSSELIEQKQKNLTKKIFWSHAKKIYGAGGSYVDNPEVDGLIYLSCFGCGTDSMTQDLLARRARAQQKPFMVVTLDEHSGEAGLVTRIEAFLDMLERRIGNETHVSPYGECLDRHSSSV